MVAQLSSISPHPQGHPCIPTILLGVAPKAAKHLAPAGLGLLQKRLYKRQAGLSTAPSLAGAAPPAWALLPWLPVPRREGGPPKLSRGCHWVRAGSRQPKVAVQLNMEQSNLVPPSTH